jgi:multidrug efflux pump
MGVAVFFGMLGVTFFGLFLTPVFYVLLRSLSIRKPLKSRHREAKGLVKEAHSV